MTKRLTWNQDVESTVTVTFENGTDTTVLVKVEETKREEDQYTLHFDVTLLGVVKHDEVNNRQRVTEGRALWQSCSWLMDGDGIQRGVKDVVHHFTSVLL